jgi:hypothetical protein
LHAEGTGIDALLLQFVFYFFFLTGSRRGHRIRDKSHKTTVYDPTVRAAVHVSRFFGVPGAACFLAFLPLGQSNSVFGIVRLKILSGEVSHAHASPGSNKRAKMKGGEARSKAPLRGTQARRGLLSIRIRSF